MATRPAQDAKARFSELQASARPSLKELLLAPEARTEALVPPRGRARRRRIEAH